MNLKPVVRILVADDDSDARFITANTLRRSGFEVTEACDGVDLLERLWDTGDGAHHPMVIVTDMMMPRCNGLKTIEALKRMHVHAAIILVSARADADLQQRGRRLGAAVLAKPFDPSELRTLVGRLTRRSRRRNATSRAAM